MMVSHHKDTGTASSEHVGHKSRCTRYLFVGIFVVILQGLAFGQQEAAKVIRTRQEVEALIKNAGASTPQWWSSVGLNYPKTLDLSWPMKPGGKWNNQKNVGQYIWDVINPNPHRWKEGIKLVHHLMIKHKNDRAKLARSMQSLGSMFYNFQKDWPRAVFWWRMSASYGGMVDPIRLANCYWQMGCEEMVREILLRVPADYTRNGEVIKLWADMGQIDKALQMAEQKARSGMPHIAYLAAGNACRQAGRYTEALAYYRKTIAARLPAKKNNDFSRAVEQAKENIDAIQLFEMLDVSKIPNGVYSAGSTAFNGPMKVEVKVTDGRIELVRVINHREKQFYTALTDTPQQIVEKQRFKGIDTVTGATITSEAIIIAAAKALASGSK
ncbi:MAG: FMN-binding protein [Sedimentisphaerales bacterium]|nr:FMN-binding protein [Sedimentisphaerales bacterium]